MTAIPPRTPRRSLPIAEWRGLARLAHQATHGVLGLVESMHRSVLDTVALRPRVPTQRTSGITGLVYRSIETVNRGVGRGLDALLCEWQRRGGDRDGEPSPALLAWQSALNGVMGDRLAADGNPLALNMQLRHAGRPLAAGADLPANASGHLLLGVHGLCMNDLQWQGSVDGHGFDHVAALAGALGATAVQLRYNTGLHISDNGREMAAQLEALDQSWPLQEISVLAHSMGGLVVRAACEHARSADMRWLRSLRRIAFLGTPHHGAPLERAGHRLHQLLGFSRFSAPFVRLGELRSAGITDLRLGHVIDPLPRQQRRFAPGRGQAQPLPLPDAIDCYAIAACLGEPGASYAGPLGDGLVPVDSALGRHRDPRFRLAFEPDRQCLLARTGHIELLRSEQVLAQLRQWWAPPR